jgi:hypothetical protein
LDRYGFMRCVSSLVIIAAMANLPAVVDYATPSRDEPLYGAPQQPLPNPKQGFDSLLDEFLYSGGPLVNIPSVLPSCIGYICLLGCCSIPELIPNSNVPTQQQSSGLSNGELLDKEIVWQQCIEKMSDGKWRQRDNNIQVSAINLKLHANPQNIAGLQEGNDASAKTVTARLVPYLIRENTEVMLLPEVPEKLSRILNPPDKTGRQCELVDKDQSCTQVFKSYYPACDVKFNDLAKEYPHFYPLAQLTVVNKGQADQLRQALQEALDKNEALKFLNHPLQIRSVYQEQLTKIRPLLIRILKQEQAEFLKRLGFQVIVVLVDEKGTTLEFAVPTDKRMQYTVKLPEQIIQYAQKESMNLETLKSFVKGDEDRCDNTNSKILSGTSNEDWSLTLECSKAPDTIRIAGFDAIPTSLESRSKDFSFRLSVHQKYWLDDQQRLVKDELSLPMNKLGTDLCFRAHSGSSPCTYRTISLLQILKQEPLVLEWGDPAKSVSRAARGHTLILIALSQGLQKWGKTIQDILYQKLLKLQSSKSIPPFELWTLQPGSRLSYWLNFEELSKLPKEGEENSILGKIQKGLVFSAPSLHALRDLELLDIEILGRTAQNKVDSIIYLTDNAGIWEDPQQIPSRQVGIPLAWRERGIELVVLTSAGDGCKVWERAAKAKCQEWHGKADAFKEVLDQFLTEQGEGK